MDACPTASEPQARFCVICTTHGNFLCLFRRGPAHTLDTVTFHL